MLINFSNHPSKDWDDKQAAAAKQFGIVEDIPFPKIDPYADKEDIEFISDNYFTICMAKLSLFPDNNNAVHIMGELTFTFCLVNKLLSYGIACVASTSERISREVDGKKITEFNFIRFREYKT